MASKNVDRVAVNDFVASAKMNETSFSRAGDVLGERTLKAEQDLDNRFAANRDYLKRVDDTRGSPGVRRKQMSAPR